MADPEALYRLLAKTNTGPAHLWGHQTELLRAWHENYKEQDNVALELPTGAGKTLVGGLIAEWLRREERKPVAYLCPTRQLAKQAHEKLESYGVQAVDLTGPFKRWAPAARMRFTNAQAVAVSTYGHVFNSSPKIQDTGTLIFDDSHAGASYVASAWTIEIGRDESLYQTVLTLLSEGLDTATLEALRDDAPTPPRETTVYLVSPLVVYNKQAQLRAAIHADAAFSDESPSTDRSHRLRTIGDTLGACLVYASHSKIEVRPFIAPTALHDAFIGSHRRVFMSATLGEGGELERAFGVSRVARMPIPRGWDKEGTGRRFFVFPEVSTELNDDTDLVAPWVQKTIELHGRTALLTPSDRESKKVLSLATPEGFVKLNGHDVENDMSIFTNNKKSILDLANRYDGVDLPDEACRLVILAGLPTNTDLQEKFLYNSVGATSVLQERIRSRLVQGMGRATRNTHDFSTVMVLGSELTNFIFLPEVLQAFREEIQAEIEFGRDESLGRSIADFDENIQAFLAQDEDWIEVDTRIARDRESKKRVNPHGTAELAKSAPHEVMAMDALAAGNLDEALRQARLVLDELALNPKTARYAALWSLFSCSWTQIQATQQTDAAGSLQRSAVRHFDSARRNALGTTWFKHLSPSAANGKRKAYDELDCFAAAQIVNLVQTKVWGSDLRDKVEEAKKGLAQKSFKPFEAGLVVLGTLAGANESFGNGSAQAAPDAVWVFGDFLWVAWEAKSEARANGRVSAKYAREASSHLTYTSSRRDEEAIPQPSFTCFVTPQASADAGARSVAGERLFLLGINDPLTLLSRLEKVWATARSMSDDLDDLVVLRALDREGCLPSQWVELYTRQPLKYADKTTTGAGTTSEASEAAVQEAASSVPNP